MFSCCWFLIYGLPSILNFGYQEYPSMVCCIQRKKRCELEGGCHRFDCLDGVCVCSSRGGSNDLGGSRPSKQTSILPQIRSFFLFCFLPVIVSVWHDVEC